jgi:FSR family fosmidomycin resistance protein-like MFS transporter
MAQEVILAEISIGRETSPISPAETAALTILASISFCHLLNDMMQSLLPAIYPILKNSLNLDFGQIGLITLAYQMTASFLQPVTGLLADRKPRPYSLAAGMCFTLAGIILLSRGGTFYVLLLAASLMGVGSSVFHPEASRIARMASGGRHGFAQSFFQVGGNFGTALGPLLAAFFVLPRGQASIAWFSAAALLGILILGRIGVWYKDSLIRSAIRGRARDMVGTGLSPHKTALAVFILLLLIFSKYFYMVSISNYFTFYLIDKFHVSVQSAQIHLFMFLGAVALGTILGGPIGDRFGRKKVIWVSILGVLPFTLMMPHANLLWTGILSIVIGLILASAFSAILVFAQDLLPGKIGMVAGLFFGFAFGMSGVGAAVLGKLADATSIAYVYRICAFLPVIGLLTAFLPNMSRPKRPA